MPMIVAREIENASPFHVERDVEVVGKLVKEMAGVRPFVATATVIRAAHVSAHADSLLRPSIPHAIGIQADRRGRQFIGHTCYTEEEKHHAKL